MPSPRKVGPGSPDEAVDLISEAEARRRYQNAWIVLAVKRYGRGLRVAAGQLVAHTPGRHAAHAAARQFGQEHPTVELAIFYNGAIQVQPGVEVIL